MALIIVHTCIMPKRYFELESDSPEESWRRIRALRSGPPPGMPSSRQTLFTSSLEQAQQQFEAAARVGFESRALNLYYGLSQAGRAVAAALTPSNIGKSPEVSGHGLRITNFQSAKAKSFWEIEIRAEGNDDTSYGRLASLLNSARLSVPVTLGEIWHMIPEVHLDHPIGTFIEPRWVHRPYASSGFSSEDVFTLQATEEEMDHDAEKLRAFYPDLREAKVLKFKGGSYSEDNGARTDEAVFSHEGSPSPVRRLRGSAALMPACGSNAEALDPLLTWWTLLYTLSMITRYKPVLWTEIIDVQPLTSRRSPGDSS
ncbi:hypothetical protein QFZ35_001043 [Arthrobacter ulcerisalmonis]|nr:YaaC family protein [Arthrobacter ulcerisalmonis]MDQ0662545.1 hypothetical protein [Arthrobacter ulcerisalmonis]